MGYDVLYFPTGRDKRIILAAGILFPAGLIGISHYPEPAVDTFEKQFPGSDGYPPAAGFKRLVKQCKINIPVPVNGNLFHFH